MMDEKYVLTAKVGGNDDLLPDILRIHIPGGSIVADVTYGRGVFWKKIDESNYIVLESDIVTGTDFKNLPYDDDSVDCVVFDPPYMGGGGVGGIKKSIDDYYRNNRYDKRGHGIVVRRYASGILEAARVLRKGGVIIVKTQDDHGGNRQLFTHAEVISLLEMFWFNVIDLFVLVQKGVPIMRHKYQKTARKNHSYAIVGKLRG